MLMLMLIYFERRTLLNGWLILADKFKRTGHLEYFTWTVKGHGDGAK
jgi:hypothetical protein